MIDTNIKNKIAILEALKISRNDLLNYVISEIKSNKDINELVGFNSLDTIDSITKKHLTILEQGIKFGLIPESIKKIMLLYKCHLNLGFQKKYFKLENYIWINAFKIFLPNYVKELINMYEMLSSNLDLFLDSDELHRKNFSAEKEKRLLQNSYEILCFEKSEIDSKLKILPEMKDEKKDIIKIFLSYLEKVYNLFIEGIYDEVESIALISELHNLVTSQIVDITFKEKPKILVTIPPQFEPVGYFFNYYAYIEANLISYLLNLTGKRSKFLTFQELLKFEFNNNLDKICIIEVDVYNLNEVIKIFEAFNDNPKLRHVEISVYGTDFDESSKLPVKIINLIKILQD